LARIVMPSQTPIVGKKRTLKASKRG